MNKHNVDANRLSEDLARLREIGCIEKIPGVNRVAYTRQENEAHLYAGERMGFMQISIDDAGNLYGLSQGEDTRKIVIGSHLDSVPNGGNYDGALGVVMCIEAARILKGRMRHSLEVVAFRAEESSRFTSSCIGSKLATGYLTAEQLKGLKDKDTGESAYNALKRNFFHPDQIGPWQASKIKFYIEPHIEQGDVLAEANLSVGVVTAIRAPVRYEATVVGKRAHSGASPMKGRKDALTGAAEMIQIIEGKAKEYETEGCMTVATVGNLQVENGAANVVAGKVAFPIDIRGTIESERNSLEAAILRELKVVAERRKLQLKLTEKERGMPTALKPEDYGIVEEAANKLGMKAMKLPSGAGHDVQYVALMGIPTAMIFVRNTGGSHNPDESIKIEDAVDATNLLVQTILEADAR